MHEIVDMRSDFVYYDITNAYLIEVKIVLIASYFSIALTACLRDMAVNLISLCLDDDIVHTETIECQ